MFKVINISLTVLLVLLAFVNIGLTIANIHLRKSCDGCTKQPPDIQKCPALREIKEKQ